MHAFNGPKIYLSHKPPSLLLSLHLGKLISISTLSEIKAVSITPLLAKPNLEKWLSYYRSHRPLTDECLAYRSNGMVCHKDRIKKDDVKKWLGDSPCSRFSRRLIRYEPKTHPRAGNTIGK